MFSSNRSMLYFLSIGLTIADLSVSGKRPLEKEIFIILVMMGEQNIRTLLTRHRSGQDPIGSICSSAYADETSDFLDGTLSKVRRMLERPSDGSTGCLTAPSYSALSGSFDLVVEEVGKCLCRMWTRPCHSSRIQDSSLGDATLIWSQNILGSLSTSTPCVS